MSHLGRNQARTIRVVLGRLGLHVSNQRIVAALARLGIEVSEDQVEMVRIERLKDTASTGRGLAYVPLLPIEVRSIEPRRRPLDVTDGGPGSTHVDRQAACSA